MQGKQRWSQAPGMEWTALPCRSGYRSRSLLSAAMCLIGFVDQFAIFQALGEAIAGHKGGEAYVQASPRLLGSSADHLATSTSAT
jgi:hypothetical protein